MPISTEADHTWAARIKLALQQELIGYCAPDNDNSGFFSFGEVLAENEGAKAFNNEMLRSGDLQKAHAASDNAITRVYEFAKQLKAEAGMI